MVSDFDWFKFCNGGIEQALCVCRIAPDLASQIGAATNQVRLDPGYAQKLVHKHKITPAECPMIGIAVQFGTMLKESERGLTFFYSDAHVFGRIYHVGLKTRHESHELWIVTFHRIRIQEMNRRLRRTAPLRVQN